MIRIELEVKQDEADHLLSANAQARCRKCDHLMGLHHDIADFDYETGVDAEATQCLVCPCYETIEWGN